MSSSETSREKLAGLTLDDVLGTKKKTAAAVQQTPPPPKSRTLLDIIREDENNKKDRRSWKAFKDKLRLKRAGRAWTSTIHIPTSDIPVQHPNSRSYTQFGRRNSLKQQTNSDSDMSTQSTMTHQVEDLDPNEDDDENTDKTDNEDNNDPPPPPATRAQFTRKTSTRFSGDSPDNNPAASPLRPQLSRRNSTTVPNAAEPFRKGRVVTFRDSFDDDEPDDEGNLETRGLSAREAVAAQEAAEAAAAADEDEEGQPQTMMSLMDLLEETDREMGLEGSRYILSDEEYDDDEDDDGEDDDEDGESVMEQTCCVCMVKHKGATSTPCRHTFCRMCSRELMVAKGNCPLCNNFILEVLEIF